MKFKEENKCIDIKILEIKKFKIIIFERVLNDKILTLNEMIWSPKKLEKVIKLTNYKFVDIKTLFIVSKTYKI